MFMWVTFVVIAAYIASYVRESIYMDSIATRLLWIPLMKLNCFHGECQDMNFYYELFAWVLFF